jgi:hypothetical protein
MMMSRDAATTYTTTPAWPSYFQNRPVDGMTIETIEPIKVRVEKRAAAGRTLHVMSSHLLGKRYFGLRHVSRS